MKKDFRRKERMTENRITSGAKNFKAEANPVKDISVRITKIKAVNFVSDS